MKELTKGDKLRLVALLFAGALVLFLVAVVTHSAAPLFVAWLPLLAIAWVLSRPEPGDPVVRAEDELARQKAEAEDVDWDDEDEIEQDEASA